MEKEHLAHAIPVTRKERCSVKLMQRYGEKFIKVNKIYDTCVERNKINRVQKL